MNDFQVLGSAITYLRRYSISSLLGIVTDKDTDASGEQEAPKKPAIDTKRLAKAIEAIAEGKYTKEELLNSFTLTSAQLKLIENI